MVRLLGASSVALASLACLAGSIAACGSGKTPVAPLDDAAAGDAATADGEADAATCASPPCPQSKIEHLVVIVMENKTFDVELGRWCTAATGSNPTCTTGPSCCEAGPATEPSGASPVNLDDKENGSFDPNHARACEADEVNGGAMDKFVTSTVCGNAHNFAYLDSTLAQPLYSLVATGAVADRYFQPLLGQSSANDQYLARAQWVFDDNVSPKGAIDAKCDALGGTPMVYSGTTLADLFIAANRTMTFYGEGYGAAVAASPNCPAAPSDCAFKLSLYPCDWAAGDDPFQYYDSTRDKAPYITDLSQLATDLAGGTLPAVSYLKPLGYKSDHPGVSDKTSDAITAMTTLVNQVLSSPMAASTLVLLTYDEGGGYFDHVKPPDDSGADHQPYGTRVPMVAFGPFARAGSISHVLMEHSSIVKFVEWNWLGGQTGQLGGRDATVNNIGSLLDPAKTGVPVPEQ